MTDGRAGAGGIEDSTSWIHFGKCKVNRFKKTNRHLEFHQHQNLAPDEKDNLIFWSCILGKYFFLAILIFFDIDEKDNLFFLICTLEKYYFQQY